MDLTIYLADPAHEPAARDLISACAERAARDRLVLTGEVVCLARGDRPTAAQVRLPADVLQVLALKGPDTFPLTLADGRPVKSGALPGPPEVAAWLADGVTEPAALVTEADSAVDFPTEMRAHISLDVTDVEAALPFYMVLFGARPMKRRADYVKFELVEPPLNLTLNRHTGSVASSGHYGVQVKSSRAVAGIRERLAGAGFAITEETETACCYAVQTKIWVADPDGNRWEVFVVTRDEADEGCGPDCICYQDMERSFVSPGAAAGATAVGP
ncbi:ArsI/CadI family heavy metal resistance metalloenzyme [Actinomadura sp. 9N407]|uniref:ArsI/CadI family heavy metal resistance metalloenzyme n=1 Tax=Actinomadura sp. 9N407 TaxID=3375154 RepID=UPI00379B3345